MPPNGLKYGSEFWLASIWKERGEHTPSQEMTGETKKIQSRYKHKRHLLCTTVKLCGVVCYMLDNNALLYGICLLTMLQEPELCH